jgi:hypothetical protein
MLLGFVFDLTYGADVATIVATTLMAIGGLGAAIAAVSQLPRLFNHAHVVGERNRLRDENKALISALSRAGAISGISSDEIAALVSRIDTLERRDTERGATIDALKARNDALIDYLELLSAYAVQLEALAVKGGIEIGALRMPLVPAIIADRFHIPEAIR